MKLKFKPYLYGRGLQKTTTTDPSKTTTPNKPTMDWWEDSDDDACMQCSAKEGYSPSCFSCALKKKLKECQIENETIKAHNKRFRSIYMKEREKAQQYETMLQILKKQVSDLRLEKKEMKNKIEMQETKYNHMANDFEKHTSSFLEDILHPYKKRSRQPSGKEQRIEETS